MSKQTIKVNIVNEMSTVKQTPQNRNNMCLQTAIYKHQQTSVQCIVIFLHIWLLLL